MTGSTRLPTSETDIQKLPDTVAVPDISVVVPATAVMLLTTRQVAVAVLGVPMDVPCGGMLTTC